MTSPSGSPIDRLGVHCAQLTTAIGRLVARVPPGRLALAAVVLGAAYRALRLFTIPGEGQERDYVVVTSGLLEGSVTLADVHGRALHGLVPYLLYAGLYDAFPAAGPLLPRVYQWLASVATIAVYYAFGKSVASARVGALAAVFAAGSGTLAPWARSLEPYAMHLLLVTLASLLFWRVLRGGERLAAPLYAFVAAIAIYVHQVAAVFIGMHGVHAALSWRVLRGRSVAAALGVAAAALAFLPWWIGGPRRHVAWYLDAVESYFLSPSVLAGWAVFVVLTDGLRGHVDPLFHRLLPWLYLAPSLVMLPYHLEFYVLPMHAAMALVVAASVVHGVRPRLTGAVLAVGIARSAIGVLEMLTR